MWVASRPRPPVETGPGGPRYPRDSLEFGRVVNLSDAVFAIALTLLVLNLGVSEAAEGRLASALADELGRLATFALSFYLIASVWWHHHRIVARLAWLEPGLIAINLGMLAAVALVPFPTSVVGMAPGSRVAVMPFIALFMVLLLLFVALIGRAQRVGAWQRTLPTGLYRWVVADWLVSSAVYGACLVLAIWAPLLALVGLALGSFVVALALGRLAPAEKRGWF